MDFSRETLGILRLDVTPSTCAVMVFSPGFLYGLPCPGTKWAVYMATTLKAHDGRACKHIRVPFLMSATEHLTNACHNLEITLFHFLKSYRAGEIGQFVKYLYKHEDLNLISHNPHQMETL